VHNYVMHYRFWDEGFDMAGYLMIVYSNFGCPYV